MEKYTNIKLLLFFSLWVSLNSVNVFSQILPIQITDGPVFSQLLNTTTGTLYIGGAFNYVNLSVTGSSSAINKNDGFPQADWPEINGSISSITPDGFGGWYVGGSFTSVGGAPHRNLVHIDAAKNVTSWHPNPDGYSIESMILIGSTLYVGGSFSRINGQLRNYLAAIDVVTGSVTGWNPNASGQVNVIHQIGDTLYVGGYFNTISGQPRKGLAAIDRFSGSVTGWNPNSDGWVFAIKSMQKTLYVGGEFTSISGQTRNGIASFDLTTGSVTGWNPNANKNTFSSGYVYALAISNNNLFVGGEFYNIGVIPRRGLAAFNVISGTLTGWNPDAYSIVNGFPTIYSIVFDNSGIYIGGMFNTIGGQTRYHLACIDSITGLATSWNPHVNSNNYLDVASVNEIAISGSTVIAGGDFVSIGGQLRNNLAALDVNSGEVLDWNPSANNSVYALGRIGNTIYAGGWFSNVDGKPRNQIAAIDAISGTATGWNPNANGGYIYGMAINNNIVYVGGGFTTIGGQPRNRIAGLDAATGTATSWNPNASSLVLTLAVNSDKVYAGGYFTAIGGQPRNYIACLDMGNGSATGWNPNANDWVQTLMIDENIVYAGGDFNLIGGLSRKKIAAIDLSTGTINGFDLNFNNFNRIYSLAANKTTLYAGGALTLIGLDKNTGSITGWNPTPKQGSIRSVLVNGKMVYSGGEDTYFFSSEGWPNKTNYNIARFYGELVPQTIIGFNPIPNLTSYDTPFTITGVSSSSGLPVKFNTSKFSIADVNGNVVSPNAIGVVTITAVLAGNGVYSYASLSQVISVTSAILVTSATIAGAGNASSVAVGASLQMIATYLPANATNTTPIWSVAPSNRALINGQGLLTGVSVGLVTVTGSFGSVFASKTISITGIQGIPVATATISGNGISIVTVGGTLQLTASYSPLNANTNTIPSWNSSNIALATVNSSGLVTALDQGVVTITSSFGAISGKYVVSIVGIPKENQALFFGNLPLNLTYGDPSFALNATVNSGLPITFSSDNRNIIQIQGNTAIIRGGGVVNISAIVPGDFTYNPAIVTQTLNIAKVELTVIGISASRYYGQPLTRSFVFQMGGFINGDTYNDIDTLPRGISATTVLTDVGNYPISFTGAVDNAYQFVYVNTGTLSILKAPQTIAGFNSIAKIKPGETITLSGIAQSNLPFNVTIDDVTIATANGLTITALKEGITEITIIQNGNNNFLPSAPVVVSLISTTTGVVSASTFGIIGKSTVGAGSFVTYKIPEKAGYKYEWSYSGVGVVLSDTVGSEVNIYFSETATSGSVTAKIIDPEGNFIKRDFIIITVNGTALANQSKDLTEANCDALLTDCELNYINLFKVGKLININSGCSKSGYGDFTSTGKIDTLRMGDKYAINIEGVVEKDGKSYFGAWVDYNNNGSFNDPDDYINVSFESATSYIIPNIIIKNQKDYEGNRRLRVAMRTSARFLNTSACLEEGEKGETEDYLIYIKAQDALEASPIITPNEDGKNDIFIVRGIDPRVENKLTILDRWGVLRFEQPNYQNDWRGTEKNLNGKPLEEGTYFYFFNNGERQIKGFVEVKRE